MTPEQTIERERRWATRAGVATLVASLLLIGSYVAYAQIPIADTFSGQLREIHDHPDALAARSLLAGIGFILLAVPVLYLFRAAQARSPRVRGGLVVFCVIGPIVFGAEAIVNWPALKQVSSDFAEQFPAVQKESYADLKQQIQKDPTSIDKATLYTDTSLPGSPDQRGVDIELHNGDLATSQYPTGEQDALTKQLDNASVDHTEDSSGELGDVLAQRISDNSSGVKIASAMSLLAALTLIVALVYTLLQAQRIGLLTRFFSTLGMALSVGLVLLPIPQLTLAFALWLGWLGLTYLGRSPRPRGPAWDAGKAVPWPAPGAPAAEPPPDATIEGTATEVTPGSENGQGDVPGGPRQKRKRRR